MTRNEGLLLLLLFSIISIKNLRNTAILLIVFLITASPYLYGNYLIHGNPVYSYNVFHFRVHSFAEGMFTGYGKVFPSASDFIAHNASWIIARIGANAIYYTECLIGFSFFGFLTVFLPFIVKKNTQMKFLPFLIFSFLIILNYILFWAAFSAPERQIAIAFILLLIPILYCIQHSSNKVIKIVAIMLITLQFIVYICYDAHRIQWARQVEPTTNVWDYSQQKDLYTYINSKIPSNAIIATTSPWMVYLYTKRPTILLPDNYEEKKLFHSFVKEYNVSFVIAEKKSTIDAKEIFEFKKFHVYAVH